MSATRDGRQETTVSSRDRWHVSVGCFPFCVSSYPSPSHFHLLGRPSGFRRGPGAFHENHVPVLVFQVLEWLTYRKSLAFKD